MSLRNACDEARLLARFILPHLVEAYAGEPARLAAVLGLANDFTDFGVATIAEAYLAHTAASVRAQEQAALRHWERIFQHATWGVALAGIDDLRFKAVNPMYASMHGYTVEELMGARVSTLWTAETQADMQRHAHETREHGRLVAETTHLCKDGTALPVEVVATTLMDERGKLTWFVANVQDITERRRHQQSLIRAIGLEAENRRIEEANRLKSEFLANMSHELRTPLNSIIGFAELLHDEQVGPIDEKQKEFLGDILAGASHLLRLINDVLDLSKVEAGKMEFRPEPVALPSLVEKVVQSLHAAARNKRLEVEVVAAPGLDEVVLDPSRFKQLLYNYVSNALKFTPDGGRVSVRLLPEPPGAFRLEVEDTGPGVPEKDMARLFVPFQQLDSGVAKAHGGTGLGLALTKRLAEAQGGTVGMRRGTQGGSVFFAVLPRQPSGDFTSTERRADAPRATWVLVVDADASHRETLLRMLDAAGYSADQASSAAEGALAWQKKRYDAIVLEPAADDGGAVRELIERVRRDAREPKVPIIAVSKAATRGDSHDLGVTELLAEPVQRQALLAALERHGAPAAHGTPVVVVDDDPRSLKLMEATLGQLGYETLCFSKGTDALLAIERVRPLAVVLDLLMPSMDGFAFLEHFRESADNRAVPVLVWTVKDLSPEERARLGDLLLTVVQKGTGDGAPLSAALRAFLPLRRAGAQPSPNS